MPIVDAFSFPPPVPADIASDEVNISPYQLIRARTSFDITYTKIPDTARRVRPSTDDPLSPLNWAGKMWDATNSGSFSVAYDDGTFSESGSFSSSGNFGEMGMERNGFFVHDDEGEDNDDAEAGTPLLSLSVPLQAIPASPLPATAINKKPEHFALLKGRVPVKVAN